MSWFTIYRPTTLSGLHLLSARQTLQQLLSASQFPRVLLFAGPKGTGKTSSARIVGALLNDPANAARVDELFLGGPASTEKILKEPDQTSDLVKRIQTGSSYVVHEMDAASNRGIDDVRRLKERIGLPPQEGKMMVYILDEVHMLTTEAFNALLKILEEPPRHVVFILATTELHKLPETVVSRCMVVRFTKATTAEIQSALQTVIDSEKVKIDPDALAELATAADGSFRDGVKLLEQLATVHKHITLAEVSAVLHTGSQSQVLDLIQAIVGKKPQEVVQVIHTLRENGVSETVFFNQVISWLYSELCKGLGVEPGSSELKPAVSTFLLTELQKAQASQPSALPHLALELQALDLVWRALAKETQPTTGGSSQGGGSSTGSVAAKTAKVASAPTPTVKKSVAAVHPSEVEEQLVVTDSVVQSFIPPQPALVGEPGDPTAIVERWGEFLDHVSKTNVSLSLLLGSARALLREDGAVRLIVYYTFHKEQLEQARFFPILELCAHAIAGGVVRLVIEVDSSVHATAVSATDANISPAAASDLESLAKQVLV